MLLRARLIFLSFLIVSLIRGQQSQNVFGHHNINDGLSQASVYAICQDSLGYMWFGTLDGLNKYDGYCYRKYRYNHKDTNSISDNITSVLYIDHDKDLWVGTFSKGLCKYSYTQDNFERFSYMPGCDNCLNHNTIRAIIQDKNGYLWIGSNNGLNRYDKKLKKFENFNAQLPEVNNKAIVIYAMQVDKNNVLWLGTSEGLMKYNPLKKKFEFVPLLGGSALGIIQSMAFDRDNHLWLAANNGIYSINVASFEISDYTENIAKFSSQKDISVNYVLMDGDENLWFGTNDFGIIYYKPYINHWQSFRHQAYNPKSLSNDRIWSIYEDKNKKIWFGTDVGGVDCYNPNKIFFEHYYKNPFYLNSLNDNNIWAFCEDSKGNLYIGTDMGGLNIYNTNTNSFSYLRAGKGKHDLISNYVRCLLLDANGNIWIGTNKGVDVLLKNGVVKHFVHDTKNNKSLACNNTKVIYEDSKKNIWIGTEIGLSCYHSTRDNFENFYIFPRDTMAVSNNRFWALHESSDGNLWVGTCGNGLYKLNLQTHRFEDYYTQLKKKNQYLNNIIRSIYEDSFGILWIGTSYGLVRFNTKTIEIKCYYEENGLPNNLIYGILPDNNNNLWISTNNGLSKFNISSEQFKNYTIIDGLQNNEFNQGAYYKSNSGKMYFGGVNGFNVFYPEKIETQVVYPKVVITDFKLFNKSLVPAKGQILETHISITNTIKISHKDNVISIDFSALNFSNPEHNYYYYKLEGFDKEWVYSGNKNTVTYTNLNPQKYIFKVKCSNNNLVWGNDFTALHITVTPPFYKTLWFLILVILFIAFVIVFYFRLRLLLLKKRNKMLTELVELRTIEISTQNSKILAQNEEITVQKSKIENQLHELKKAYSELEKLSFIASRTDNAVIICNSKGVIEWTNQAFRKFYSNYKMDLDKLLGINIKEFYSSSEINVLIDKCIKNRETVSFSSTLTAKHKDTKYIQTTLTYVYNENLNYSNIIAVASDYTQIKQTLDELSTAREAAEADRTKMDFLANMSHEIRTPLNAILGFTDLLKAEISTAKSKEYLNIISDNAYALLKLITDILEIAKTDINKTSFALSPINIVDLVKEIISIYQIELLRKQLQIDISKPNDFPEWVAFDNSRLRQILLNILGNAIKFTEKGKIVVRLEIISVDKEFGSADILIEITDSGVGMNAEMQSQIFGLFQQADTGIDRKYDGLGIGLSVTKKLIDVLGGTISIESEQGRGTKVFIGFKNVSIIDNYKKEIDTAETSNKEIPNPNGKNQLYTLLSSDVSDVNINFNKNQLDVLLQYIDDNLIEELMYIRKSAKINQIKSFASKITDNPIFDDLVMMKNLGKQLHIEAESFNVRNINLILDKINEIILFIKTIP